MSLSSLLKFLNSTSYSALCFVIKLFTSSLIFVSAIVDYDVIDDPLGGAEEADGISGKNGLVLFAGD